MEKKYLIAHTIHGFDHQQVVNEASMFAAGKESQTIFSQTAVPVASTIQLLGKQVNVESIQVCTTCLIIWNATEQETRDYYATHKPNQ